MDDKFDSMVTKGILITGVVSVIGAVAVFSGAAYVAIHFLQKVW